MNKKGQILAIAASMVMSVANSMVAIAAGEHVSRPFDWTLQLNTKELKNQFEYNGSQIKPVIKVSMQFFKMSDEANKTSYEDIWYSKTKILGLQKQNKLDTMTAGDAIAIQVKHEKDNPSYDEQRTAGKAIIKAIVDANLNKNMVATIKVPINSFYTISSEIQNYHFIPAPPSNGDETPVDSNLNLFLESEPQGLTQSFIHQN